jgi:tRNA (guanine-N7-)-methyltransferase
MPSPTGKPAFNPRMHQGGKLSFRARTNDSDEDPGDRIVFGGQDPPPLDELVPAGFRDIEVEIGSGKGGFLLAASERQPDVFFLGIEAATGYASLAASRLNALDRRNALLLVDNGKLYLEDRVPAGALRAVHVYYPDPWPKRRHAGRRFFTDEVPAVIARALRADGWLYVATDNPGYAGQIARVIGKSEHFARDEAEERRLLQDAGGLAFSPTNFERKYREEGRILRRYAFAKVAP